jgi:putative sterol carrier protein
MTVDELFEALPTRFQESAAVGLTKSIQWNITGAESGVWAFEIIDGVGRVVPGGVENPDITFTVTDTIWVAIAEGRQDATKAFMTGKLTVSGDMMLALKVPDLFPVPAA